MPAISATATRTQQSQCHETLEFTDAMYRRCQVNACRDLRPAAKQRYIRTHSLLPAAVVISRTEVRVPSLERENGWHTVNPQSSRCDCPSFRRCWHAIDAEIALYWADVPSQTQTTEAQRQALRRSHEARYGSDVFRVPSRGA